MTSDLQTQILDRGCFVGPTGTSNQIQDFTGLPPATMETGSMEEVPNQGDQNQQPCKYDLLSSVPRESESQGCKPHNSLQGFLVRTKSTKGTMLPPTGHWWYYLLKRSSHFTGIP